VLLLSLVVAALGGCAFGRREPVVYEWVMGRPLPAFDPDGVHDPQRWALERLLTRGLLAVDSAGQVLPDAAVSWEVSQDSLVWTFRLDPRLRFGDGTSCTSADFAHALEAGLGREDHSSRRFLLQAVAGVLDGPSGARPAIETPDPLTLVIRLSRRERTLLRRLAAPGVTGVWRDRTPGRPWKEADGLGPYRVSAETEGRLVLARAGRGGGEPDTVRIRSARGAARARTRLRAADADLVWPLPPGLLDEPLPSGYRLRTAEAVPAHLLVLVLRADVQPTVRLGARRALAHAVQHAELPRALGPGARPPGPLIPGVPPLAPPRLDATEVELWLKRGRLGRSLHATLVHDADAPWAALAGKLQGDWSRDGLVVDLLPLRGQALEREMLAGRRAQLALVEWAPPLEDARASLAAWIAPPRGGPVAPFGTGWRVRDLDRWAWPRTEPGPIPADALRQRFEQEMVVLPLATLDHRWVERARGPWPAVDPRTGPDPTRLGRASGD
jgi:hypothetical protein